MGGGETRACATARRAIARGAPIVPSTPSPPTNSIQFNSFTKSRRRGCEMRDGELTAAPTEREKVPSISDKGISLP